MVISYLVALMHPLPPQSVDKPPRVTDVVVVTVLRLFSAFKSLKGFNVTTNPGEF